MEGADATTADNSSEFFRVEWVTETGSTNDDLLEAAKSGASAGLVRVADYQTAGRGRRDRTWQAPPKSGLLCSILLRPHLDPADVPLLTLALALAASDAIREVAGLDVAIKWPNDLIVPTERGERKLGGILAQSVVSGSSSVAVVLGIGINLAWPDDVPDEIRDLAVSLGELVDEVPSREAALGALLRCLYDYATALEGPGGPEAFIDVYRERCITMHRRVEVALDDRSVVGIVTGVSPEGGLIIDTGAGLTTVLAGDVAHVVSTRQ